MRILVTGGSGSVGCQTVERLAEHGHHVRVIGRSAGEDVFGWLDARAEYRQCDVTDFAALQEQMRGMERVVHLAAIPHPAQGTGPAIFRVNCAGTFNVYEAAAQVGIKRVVSASSIQALGHTSGVRPFGLSYFPIDEAHPTCTTDPYGFSKQVIEEIAAYYWRREGISGVCLRLPAVSGSWEYHRHRRHQRHEHDAHDHQHEHHDPGEWAERHRASMERAYGSLLALPEDERPERAQRVIAGFDALQVDRVNEKPHGWWRGDWMKDEDRPIIMHMGTLWSALDGRDSAQAIERGLLAEYEGSHPLYVADVDNCVGIESEVLAGLFFPGVKERKRPLVGAAALVSSDRARDLIGFEPEYSAGVKFRSLAGGQGR